MCLALLAPQARLDLQEILAPQGRQVQLVPQVLQVLLEQLVRQAQQVPLAPQARLDLQEILGLLVPRGPLVRLVPLEQLVQQVRQVPQVPLGLLVQREIQDRQDQLDQQAQLQQ